jgi:hypothetical protein
MGRLGINHNDGGKVMTTETKPKKSYFSRKKNEPQQNDTPAATETKATPEERKHEPNPATVEARERIYETGRAAAYAAEALVPNNARNREGQIAKVRHELQRDAVGDLIAKGKIRLPDRPAASHSARAMRNTDTGIELS